MSSGILSLFGPSKYEKMRALFTRMLDGAMSDAEIAAALTQISEKGFDHEEILSGVDVLRERMTVFEGAEDAFDCCGTGGDRHGTVNISTAVTFVLAGGGVRVAKHGNRAVSSKSGSSDMLQALGVSTDVPQEIMQKALKSAGVCFLAAPLYHPAMKRVAAARKQLGTRTIFNLLGPLASPARVKRQLIGVYDKIHCRNFSEILKKLGSTHALVVHGRDGMDEITTTTATDAVELKNGGFQNVVFTPEKAGMLQVTLEDLKGGDAVTNAEKLKALLKGEKGPYRDIVVLNAAVAFAIADKASGLEEGLAMARDSLDSGAANHALQRLISITNGGA